MGTTSWLVTISSDHWFLQFQKGTHEKVSDFFLVLLNTIKKAALKSINSTNSELPQLQLTKSDKYISAITGHKLLNLLHNLDRKTLKFFTSKELQWTSWTEDAQKTMNTFLYVTWPVSSTRQWPIFRSYFDPFLAATPMPAAPITAPPAAARLMADTEGPSSTDYKKTQLHWIESVKSVPTIHKWAVVSCIVHSKDTKLNSS